MATKDIKPQLLSESISESAANTYTQEEIDVIGYDLQDGYGIEILKVFWTIGKLTLDAAFAHNQVQAQICRSSQTAIVGLDNPDLVAPGFRRNYYHNEVGTSANVHSTIVDQDPTVFDLTDGNGNGMIFAGPKIYLGIKGEALDAAGQINVDILYRVVKMSTKELLGSLAN